jgi:hypothetical protein
MAVTVHPYRHPNASNRSPQLQKPNHRMKDAVQASVVIKDIDIACDMIHMIRAKVLCV